MQKEKALRAARFLTKIHGEPEENHERRIRLAANVVKIMNDFIAHEVQKANSRPKTSQHYLSWDGVAQILGISKTAAYSRYGKQKPEQN